MTVTYTIAGVAHSLTLPEDAVRQIFEAYQQLCDEADVDYFLDDVDDGGTIIPDNVTAMELRKHKDELVKLYRGYRDKSENWRNCLEAAVDSYALDKRFSEM